MSDQNEKWRDCPHNTVTSHGKGWVCCSCGVGLLSLMVPIPMPLIEAAAAALAGDGEAGHES